MPKPRKPLVMQKGNLTILQQKNKQLEEETIVIGNEDLDIIPDWLIDGVAREEYNRITKALKTIEMIGNLDLNNIVAYCNAYSSYRKVTNQLSGQMFYIERETRTGIIVVKNPLVDIQTNYANEMRRFGACIGMDVNSRLKLATTKVNKVQDEIGQKFGNI